MSATSFSHHAGEQIAGNYLLLRLLEIGGMGAVWVAHHLALDVHVALKFIRPETATSKAEERLLREAQVAARVRHPAVVKILDVGRTGDGEAFLAMELLDGELLADVLHREGRLDPATAIRVLLPIAEALDAIHRTGAIHRDVKPENIFLTQNDAGRWQPKLLDFGLARSMDPRAARITETGALLGTPEYMSFERLTGEDVDQREDVYALAVVVYQAITGESPFPGRSVTDVMRAVAVNQPRSTVEHGAGDEELWAIVKRGLASQNERWASAWDMGRALAGWAWKNGTLDDIVGMSLGPVWIEDAPRRLSEVRSWSPAPLARRVHTPSALQKALQPTIPCKRDPALARRDPPAEDPAPDDVAPCERPRKRTLPALAVGLAVLAIAGWSTEIIQETHRERVSAAFEATPGTERSWTTPVLVSTTAPVVASPPPSPPASPAPTTTPAAPPAPHRERQARATPVHTPAPQPQPAKPAPQAESWLVERPLTLKNPYD